MLTCGLVHFMTYVLFPYEDNPDFLKVSLKNFKIVLKPARRNMSDFNHTYTDTLSIYLNKRIMVFKLKIQLILILGWGAAKLCGRDGCKQLPTS